MTSFLDLINQAKKRPFFAKNFPNFNPHYRSSGGDDGDDSASESQESDDSYESDFESEYSSDSNNTYEIDSEATLEARYKDLQAGRLNPADIDEWFKEHLKDQDLSVFEEDKTAGTKRQIRPRKAKEPNKPDEESKETETVEDGAEKVKVDVGEAYKDYSFAEMRSEYNKKIGPTLTKNADKDTVIAAIMTLQGMKTKLQQIGKKSKANAKDAVLKPLALYGMKASPPGSKQTRNYQNSVLTKKIKSFIQLLPESDRANIKGFTANLGKIPKEPESEPEPEPEPAPSAKKPPVIPTSVAVNPDEEPNIPQKVISPATKSLPKSLPKPPPKAGKAKLPEVMKPKSKSKFNS